MSLRYIEVSKPAPGCISVSGQCDLGTSTPVLPGEYVGSLLRSLAPPEQVIVGELPAPRREQRYYLDSSSPCCPLQPRWFHPLLGRGIVLGALRAETAPLWFEKCELLRGYVIEPGWIERLGDLLARRHPLQDVLEVAAVRFELYSTKTLLLQSRSLTESEMVEAAVITAESLGLSVQKDTESLTGGKTPPRLRLIERVIHRASH